MALSYIQHPPDYGVLKQRCLYDSASGDYIEYITFLRFPTYLFDITISGVLQPVRFVIASLNSNFLVGLHYFIVTSTPNSVNSSPVYDLAASGIRVYRGVTGLTGSYSYITLIKCDTSDMNIPSNVHVIYSLSTSAIVNYSYVDLQEGIMHFLSPFNSSVRNAGAASCQEFIMKQNRVLYFNSYQYSNMLVASGTAFELKFQFDSSSSNNIRFSGMLYLIPLT